MCISKKISLHRLVPIIKSLHQCLDNISENPQLFFDESSFPLMSQFKATSQETKESLTVHMKEGMETIIITISTALSKTIKAQLPDFLGGKYSDPSKLLDCSFAPLTNLVSERNFGHLDASQKRRPHGSLHHHTSVILLKQTRSKLRHWYRGLKEEERKALWDKARKKGKLLRKKHIEQDRRAIMEALPVPREIQVDVATIQDTLEEGKMIVVACQDTCYPATVQRESAPGENVSIDFAEIGKLLGSFKWPNGHDVHEISRTSILEIDVHFEPRAGGRSWMVTNANAIQAKFKKSI